jgi:transketolase
MGLEDLALMRSLPGMKVYQPADDLETAQIVEHLCNDPAPAYLRLTRHNVPRVHGEGYRFEPGKLDVLRQGADVALLTGGGVVGETLQAADQLKQDGLDAAVINVPTVKPIDAEGLSDWAGRVPLMVSVEDHNVLGGLGSAIAEVVVSLGKARLHIHGVRDAFGESGSQAELYRKHGLDAAGIAEAVRNARGG